jgi:hypothetical protein
MSYIRAGHSYEFVVGISDDYIYPAGAEDGSVYIEDYGHISNNTIVELFCKFAKIEDEMFREYLIKTLPELTTEALEYLLADPIVSTFLTEETKQVIRKKSKGKLK